MLKIKVDILAIGAHPDDVELSCSGTLLGQISLGRKVGLLDLTRGELGSRGSASIRDKEAVQAAKLMQASVRENAGMSDGFFQHTPENLLKIIRVIRQYQPTIVLTNALSDRHPDHGRAAKLATEACFLAGLLKIKTRWQDETQVHWRPKAVYHYIQDRQLQPDFVVDITPFMEQKMNLIKAYKSQFYDPDSKEPNTPISSASFIDFMYAKARVFARPIGVDFAEGFQVARPIGVSDIMDLL